MIEILKARSGNCCELCGATENLGVYTVPPARNESTDNGMRYLPKPNRKPKHYG